MTIPERTSLLTNQESTDQGEVQEHVLFLMREQRFEEAIELLQGWKRQYRATAHETANLALKQLAKDGAQGEAAEHLRAYLMELEPDLASEVLVKKAHRFDVPLDGFSSFRRSMAMRSRSRSLTRGSQEEWVLNGKLNAYAFADQLGVQYPKTYLAGVPLTQVEAAEQGRVVIKPLNGSSSQGVFVVISPDRIFDVPQQIWLDSWEELISTMRAGLESGRVGKDSWVVEELILEDEEAGTPGRDLKFYCFYGRVGLVLEIRRRGDGVAYCEWDGQGQPLYSGKYVSTWFQGDGVTQEQLDYAASISSKIPAPFMRIDFLKAQNAPAGMVFGEFTPRPGNFHAFNDAVDRMLGDAFLAAEGRLNRDLVQRKNGFREFRELLKQRAKSNSRGTRAGG